MINMNRILVIEENRILREGIAAMLNKQADMRVKTTIGSDNDILQKVSRIKPHVILLDMGLKKFIESSFIESIKANMPETKLIGMGSLPSQSDIVEFVEAGASGFILKDSTPKEYLGTIRSVAQGENVLPHSLAAPLFSHVIENAHKKNKRKPVISVRITKRERDIAVLIADGLSNKEIAQQLNIAIHTVKSHVHNIMEKLALHTRLQIAKLIHEENS
jgi:DNA-binding NarL/FixJ family response regulator